MKNTSIEWTEHTFNPWWGCYKVSPACEHCYAESIADRFGGTDWRVGGKRRFFGPEHWAGPLKWNAEANETGVRSRVFCASMADVFEDRRDLNAERDRLWKLIDRTPSLDWLLLTKRPEMVQKYTPWGNDWPSNVWLGTTVESQKWANERIPTLLGIPAKVRFLSCEPLLGPIDLFRLVPEWLESPLHWIIAGGESGRGARPTDPDWLRDVRDFCAIRQIPFLFKQWGHWSPGVSADSTARTQIMTTGVSMLGLGKTLGGRLLDGVLHDGRPQNQSILSSFSL